MSKKIDSTVAPPAVSLKKLLFVPYIPRHARFMIVHASVYPLSPFTPKPFIGRDPSQCHRGYMIPVKLPNNTLMSYPISHNALC